MQRINIAEIINIVIVRNCVILLYIQDTKDTLKLTQKNFAAALCVSAKFLTIPLKKIIGELCLKRNAQKLRNESKSLKIISVQISILEATVTFLGFPKSGRKHPRYSR